MELDFNTLVRDRLRTAEEAPPCWRKELVWTALEQMQANKKLRNQRWMIAASWVLALCVLTAVYQKEPKTELVTAATKHIFPSTSAVAPSEQICNLNEKDQTLIDAKSKMRKNVSGKTTTKQILTSPDLSNLPSKIDVSQEVDIPQEIVKLHTNTGDAPLGKTQDQQTIKPIIGYLPKENYADTKNQEKKSRRLRLHKQHETTETTEYTQSLLARIK